MYTHFPEENTECLLHHSLYYPLRQGLSLNIKLLLSAELAREFQGPSYVCTSNTGLTNTYDRIGVGVELVYSCLHDNHSFTQSHIPSPSV